MRVVVEEDDVHLVAEVVGSGRLLLFHPGLGRWGRDFEVVLSDLVDAGHRVAMLDPRGVGESSGPLDGLTLHELARDVLRVAHRLSTPPFHLIGHAFGSRVVRCAAADAPHDVASLALLAAGGGRSDNDAFAGLRVAMDSTHGRETRLQALRTSMFAPGNDPSSWLEGWHPAAAAAQQRAASATERGEWELGGSAPVLVVHGRDDRLAPHAAAVDLVAKLGERAAFVELDRAGHALLPEQPAAIAVALLDFYRRH